MVIRGNSRSNARQLSHYLLTKSDNEAIRVFEVDGQLDADNASLHRSVYIMGLSSELSKSEKGLYHAQINPAPDEEMNDDRWLQATDILAQQLGLENQRRAVVLHTKKGRTHAHVVWERFDHEHGKMVSDSFSRLAQDRARKEMELAFSHKPTPHRNKHRPELKAALSELWQQTDSGTQFVKNCHENKYWIAAGSGRSPYVVVDENGRSYDLTRQLRGVRLKDVRHRLRGEALPGEKEAIELARNSQATDTKQKEKGTQQQSQRNGTTKNVYQQPSLYSIASGGMAFSQPDKNIKTLFMENKGDNYYDFLDRLDAEREQALRAYSKDIEARKEEYDRVYYLQVDEYKAYNKVFGKNKRGIEPQDYNKMLDAELLAYARELEKEQQEQAKEKVEIEEEQRRQQQEEQDTTQKFKQNEAETTKKSPSPQQEPILKKEEDKEKEEQKREQAQANDRAAAKEKEREQRRQEFRQSMKEAQQQHGKDQGKGKGPELE